MSEYLAAYVRVPYSICQNVLLIINYIPDEFTSYACETFHVETLHYKFICTKIFVLYEWRLEFVVFYDIFFI